jgi:hypothetical protein
MTAWIILAVALVAVALAAPRYGADTRKTPVRIATLLEPVRRASLRADLAAAWRTLTSAGRPGAHGSA